MASRILRPGVDEAAIASVVCVDCGQLLTVPPQLVEQVQRMHSVGCLGPMVRRLAELAGAVTAPATPGE